MPYQNPADLKAMLKGADLNLLQQVKVLHVGYLAYNTTVDPFDNPKVRKVLH